MTRPVPDPATATVTVTRLVSNVAVTVRLALIWTKHVRLDPKAAQAPPHVTNLEVVSGVAVSRTSVPVTNGAWQATPHWIPGGALTTVPPPVPFFVTVSVNGATTNVTPRLTSGAVGPGRKLHLAVWPPDRTPVGHPDTKATADPAEAVAVKLIGEPVASSWRQSPDVIPPAKEQLIPGPLTTPAPVPEGLTVTWMDPSPADVVGTKTLLERARELE